MGNHRADRRGLRQTTGTIPARAGNPTDNPADIPADIPAGARTTGGKRKASRRRSVVTRVPAVPTIVGAVALVTAAGAALNAGSGDVPSGSQLKLSSQAADSLSGTDAFGIDLSSRQAALSRDSERQALQDAAAKNLKAAVEEQSQQRNAALASLAASAQKRADQIAKNLWIAPVEGYHLTARFGQYGLWSNFHTGLDFAGPYGSPIHAIAAGTITFAGYDGAYGNKTVETLDDGTEIWYCHQSEIDVQVGERVTQGEHIGNSGATGHVTGPHVHIEVRPGGGDPVDPYPAFVAHGFTP